MDNIILNKENYGMAANLKVPMEVIHGRLDPLVIGANLRKLAERNAHFHLTETFGGHDIVGAKAKKVWAKLDAKGRKRVADSVLCGQPGTVDDLTPEEFLSQLKTYDGIDDKKLRENMYWFLNEISPILEETGVNMCIHPDDPPHPIFGLPRILSNAKDIAEMYKRCPSKHVGLTLCTGSLGGDRANDAVEIMKKFGSRVYFCHFRNLEYTDDKVFHESQCHLVGQTDIPALFEAFLKEEKRRGEKIVVRPDHGRFLEIDKTRKCYCGYSYGGRLIGLAELRGLEIGLKYAKKGL
jgi:mannonate dehydratase